MIEIMAARYVGLEKHKNILTNSIILELFHCKYEGQSICSRPDIQSKFIGLTRYEKSQKVTTVTFMEDVVYRYYLHTPFLEI